ncbi:MAG TPA: alanine racemase C-terminal domain-containing protein, partial [Candidatus Limnocylindria bacterium]|nr:alanine racemase C-terminal domain-containing protein [Candidatus Limnocylindria bacterium]
LGLGLYGINTSPHQKLNLQPALEMRSAISSVKTIQPGEKVGYGITFEAQKPMKIATVPVGYNEGMDRRLSNKGFYKVGSTFCPLVGRVSMNMSSIDVTEIPGVKLEDEVVVISSVPTDKNSVESIAQICGCITHEILVHIPKDLRRVII